MTEDQRHKLLTLARTRAFLESALSAMSDAEWEFEILAGDDPLTQAIYDARQRALDAKCLADEAYEAYLDNLAKEEP